MNTIPNNCACPPNEIVQIPGVAGTTGPAGAAGAAGISALTSVVTAGIGFVAVGSNTSFNVLDGRWILPGQTLFITDGTNNVTLVVQSITYGVAPITQASVTAKRVASGGDTWPNTGTGTTIVNGANVSPSGYPGSAGAAGTNGTNGTNGFTVLGTISQTLAGSTNITGSAAAALAGTSLTLSATPGKTYLLSAFVRVDFVAASTTGATVKLTINRTNNGGTVIGGYSATVVLPDVTTKSYTAGQLVLLQIPYTTVSSGPADIIQPFLQLSAGAVGAGNLQCVEATLSATELT